MTVRGFAHGGMHARKFASTVPVHGDVGSGISDPAHPSQ
jgi:hypothetical protein